MLDRSVPALLALGDGLADLPHRGPSISRILSIRSRLTMICPPEAFGVAPPQ